MRRAALLLIVFRLLAAGLEISRPARSWEFLDAVGPKAALFGKEDGTLEAYVYPLKIFRDFRLQFRVGGRSIPGESLVRSIDVHPGVYTLRYGADEFQVEQTLAASLTEPGVVMRLRVRSAEPVAIEGGFIPDFQLMWPASFGSGYAAWQADLKAWLFGADGQPFAAVFGSPGMTILDSAYATNYSTRIANRFSLGEVTGFAERWILLAGSVRSRDEALSAYRRLLEHPDRVIASADAHYRQYLSATAAVELPDAMLQKAYDWARISLVQGMVENPMLGRGLVAGYGLSKGAYRPGFAWYFGRDTFWSSFALTAAGDFENARAAIEFIARFQRDDGKIPHEISQSAALIDWFKQYPYGYASADATPLFVIAVRDYMDASGDLEFVRSMLPRLKRAFDFMRSTFGAGGFPKNAGVGHGWVEGGPLLPVQTELYQAGCYVAALDSMAAIENAVADAASAARFEDEYRQKRQTLNNLFWLAPRGVFAFALDENGRPVDEPSVLATVPMWFRVLDQSKAQTMIETLARPEFKTPWGMRIIGASSPKFGPAGYHFGSVWPLFTGWASVGEYRNHMASAALANLRANAWLALDGSPGNVTEVLSGLDYSPLSTSSPHQIWSAAMVVSPILRGLLGLRLDALHQRVAFEPHLPPDWQFARISHLRLGPAKLNFALRHASAYYELNVTNAGDAPIAVEFAPSFPKGARINRASVGGSQVKWVAEDEGADFHARLRFSAKPGVTTVRIEHEEPARAPQTEWKPPALGEIAPVESDGAQR
jgi:glycogen debranching enzyme